MKTSIVIATFNKLEYTRLCIESIREYTNPEDYEIIIIDNHSTDGTVEWIKDQTDITYLLNEQNEGFPKACNQGIALSTGDHILLLNNDTIVTKNWLDNLTISLNSNEKIGAVSCITNNCSYSQTIDVPYHSIDEIQTFAATINISNPNLWEQRLKLIGFCMLIKRSVIDEIGLLDDIFTPGNYEDDDYSHRIRLAGYKLLLCKDTFIHHFGSVSMNTNNSAYEELLKTNSNKFFGKWNFAPEHAFSINFDLANEIRKPKTDFIKVLHIGCRSGGTLLEVKNKFKHAELYGIEWNPFEASSAQIFAEVLVDHPMTALQKYPESFFDVIIISDVPTQGISFQQLLYTASVCLKTEGQFIQIFNNKLHYSILKNSIIGLENTQLQTTFSLVELEQLFTSSNFVNITISPKYIHDVTEDEKTIMHLAEISGEDPDLFKHYQYIVSGWQKNWLMHAVDQLMQQNNVAWYANELHSYSSDNLIQTILQQSQEPVLALNMIGLSLIEYGHYNQAINYLTKSFELDQHNPSTVSSLGLVSYHLQQLEIALKWFELIPVKDTQTELWIRRINKELHIKNESDAAELISLNEDNIVNVINQLLSGQLNIEQLLELVYKTSFNSSSFITTLAVTCYNNGAEEFTIPLLSAGLELFPNDHDLLLNLTLVLEAAQEYELALSFIRQINDDSSEVKMIYDRLLQHTAKEDHSLTRTILSMEQNDVQFTGERLVINQTVKETLNNVMEEHLARYELASQYVKGKIVVDAACGAGYGSFMMDQAGASQVIGIDISEESVESARKSYTGNNTKFEVGDVHRLNITDQSVDVVVSFETIEHIKNGAIWIEESARVLKENGLFIVSTPNRHVTNPGIYLEEKPLNHFHEYEYSTNEFLGELLRHYDILEIYGQTIVYDHLTYYYKVMREARQLDMNYQPQTIPNLKETALVSFSDLKNGQPLYNVVVCRKK